MSTNPPVTEEPRPHAHGRGSAGSELAADLHRETSRTVPIQTITVSSAAPLANIVGYCLELWHYRELFYFLVWRDVKVRYKQSLLGATWAVIQPFMMMVVFTIFFSKLDQNPAGEMAHIPAPIFFYSALLPWTYFSSSLSAGGISLESNRELITKVYFPRVIVPGAAVFRGLVDFGIAAIVLGLMLIWYREMPSPKLMLWPLLLIPLVMFTLGITLFLAALNVKYRDIKHALPFIVQLGLFLTPIIYPLSLIPKQYHWLIGLYPMAGLIQAFRASLIRSEAIETGVLAISCGMACVFLVFGLWYFRRTERYFADIV